MKPSEVLIAAKALIDAPEKWTQGREALDCNGEEVSPTNENACRFCMVGAVRKAGSPWSTGFEAQVVLLRTVNVLNLELWNDAPERTWEEVQAAFDRAIALAQEAGE